MKFPWDPSTPTVRDSFRKDNLMLSTISHEETGQVLGMYISMEPFSPEDALECVKLLHSLLHKIDNKDK